MWEAPFKMCFKWLTATSWCSCPWSVGWSQWPASDEQEYSKSDGTSLLRLSLWFLSCSLWFSVDKANCHAVGYGLPMAKFMMQGTQGSLQPKAKQELRPSVQQCMRNCILPTTIWVGLEATLPQAGCDRTPALADTATAFARDLESEHPAKPPLDSPP